MRKLLSAAAASLLLASCADTLQGKSLAEAQVRTFHEQFNAARFDDLYDGANPALRVATPKDRFLALLGAIARKLGKQVSSEQSNWSVNTNNMVTRVVLVEETRFEQGRATETFTYRIDEQKATLIGYNISSLDMMVR